jgi:hypothetical protein
MTELEDKFLQGLITAVWPLYLQVAFAVGISVIYYFWSILFYRVFDVSLRSFIGHALHVRIIWVLRHSSNYHQTQFEFGVTPTRYRRWTWGIEMEDKRTFFRDGAVSMLSLLVVNILAGLWPIAVFFYVFISLKALSYVVFLPSCIVLLIIYSTFWAGRHKLKGMQL